MTRTNQEDLNLGMRIFYMRKAIELARYSSDPSTQNGAYLISNNYSPLTSAINCPPPGTTLSTSLWNKRPEKYFYVEHAERNVIYQAANQGIKLANTILVCPFCACADCARAIIISGVSEIVRLKNKQANSHARWEESILVGDQMMKHANVQITELDYKFDIELRRNEQIILI